MASLNYSTPYCSTTVTQKPWDFIVNYFQKLEPGLKRISTNLWISLFVLFVFDALANPYAGIVHDARLYALQALSYIHPGRYNQDLFFLFGSQDSYSVFSPIYAQFIKLLGLQNGSFVLYLLSKGIYFLSLLLFFREFCKNKTIAFLAAVVILSDNIHYIFFDINEPFLTPRIAAQAFSLFSLWAVLKSRLFWTILFLLLSALFHPIMAVGAGSIACITWAIRKEWKNISLSAILLLSGCFMIKTFSPDFFNQLTIMQPFDLEWHAIVLERSPHLFPGEWTRDEWILILISTAVAVFSCFFILNDQKNIIAAAIITTGFCIFLTAVFTNFFPFSFPIQIQPWRSFWILRILNPLLCIQIGYMLWENNNFWQRLAATLLIITAFMGGGIGSDEYQWIFPIIILCILPIKWADHLRDRMKNFIFGGLLVLLLFISLSGVFIQYSSFSNQMSWQTGIPAFVHISGQLFPLILCGLFCCLYTFISVPVAAFVSVCFFIMLCFFNINPNLDYPLAKGSTQTFYKYNLSNICKQDKDKIIISPGSLIVSLGVPVTHIWFKLHSASYWSWDQGAGVVFNRDLAFEYERRRLKIKKMNTIYFCDKNYQFDLNVDLKKNQKAYLVNSKELPLLKEH